MRQDRPMGGEPVVSEAPPKPRGVGIAVAFDWTAAALVPSVLVLGLVRGDVAERGQAVAVYGFLALLAVPPFLLLGEALRQGREAARVLQLLGSGLALVVNTFGLLRDIIVLTQGGIPRSTNLPSLIADLWILWGLTRPQTVRWFAEITPAAARRHHGGRWLLLTILASLAAGLGAALINFG